MRILISVIVSCICTVCSVETRAELAAVWAVDDSTKVLRDEVAHRLRDRNVVWRDGVVRVWAMRNETVSFQVVLVGGSEPTPDVSVSLGPVGQVRNGAVTNDPDRYFIGRRVELFWQRYLYVDPDARSVGIPWDAGRAQPDVDGWVPDPLVPTNLAPTATVGAGRNQGVWVDLWVPRDASAGAHRGQLVVRVAGQETRWLPVELRVVDATVPDEPPVATMLWFSGYDDSLLGRYYGDFAGIWLDEANKRDHEPLRERHYKLARRHLVTLFHGKEGLPNEVVRRRLSGAVWTRESGYEGWGEGRGQDVYSIKTYGGELDRSGADAWSAFFRDEYPDVPHFLYVWDEPGVGNHADIERVSAAAKPVPSFVTAHYTPELPSVDVFASHAWRFSVDGMRAGESAGKRVWIYNGARPHTGTFMTDDVAVSLRLNPWIQYRYEIPRWFYWESTYYWDGQGGRGAVDVWNEALTFTNAWRERGVGDGVLFYPGTDLRFPGGGVGFRGPLPSIRIKQWRRGVQDVALLREVRRRGFAVEHDAALSRIVRGVLQDRTDADDVAWPEDGEVWSSVRIGLMRLIEGGSEPDSGVRHDGAVDASADSGAVADAGSVVDVRVDAYPNDTAVRRDVATYDGGASDAGVRSDVGPGGSGGDSDPWVPVIVAGIALLAALGGLLAWFLARRKDGER